MSDNAQPMIRAEALTKEFEGAGGSRVLAVQDATLSVYPGEIFGLLGPNGAGKTTLLRMLGTIITPTSGTCSIGGRPTHDAPADARRKVGFLSGNTKLYGRLTARELLRYFGRLFGMHDTSIARRTEDLADSLCMRDFLDRRCEALSTGQSQKVSIARVLLHDPPVLILDEPTLGLDIMTSKTILDFIIDAKQRNHCIIFSTHYMTEADLLCDRVGLMYSGRILAMGTKASLFEQTHTDNLKDAFLALVEERKAAVP
ncbi:MAG: ATP-binding cassette domain-containing protein [Candidatus Hydrogenedentes bacterium]|nr:ATP-binding cassette domain-containing protein [Candidatus Hydrogenedentota bacterium]